ncbi:MAG: hypothetical protein ACOZNI_06550 [Myxococcota bacterium]
MRKSIVAVGCVALAIVVACVGVPVGVLGYWHVWLAAEVVAEEDERLAPVVEAFAAGRAPDVADVERLAADRNTRAALLDRLAEHGATDLAAERWRTGEARSEGDLVRWLRFPTELDAFPDEVALAARGYVGEERWFVWRFRVDEPHWAARDGWMMGVSGPWPAEAGAPMGTWSELEPFTEHHAKAMIAEQHARLREVAPPEVRLELVAP